MTRTEFIKTIGGIFGITIVAPGVIAEVTKPEPEYVISADIVPGDGLHISGFDPITDRSIISPLQEYSPKDWSGLTTKHHLGAMLKWDEQDLTVTQFLHKFDK